MYDDPYVNPRETIARRTFRHAEAYPRLNFFAAQRAILEGRTICVFEREHRGRVGHFQFRHYEADEGHERGLMHGLCETFPDDNLLGSSAQVAFRLRLSGNFHYYALCPQCQKRKARLVFVRTWMCQKCHGLKHRSQLIDPNFRRDQRASEIEKLTHRGRPKGMHNRTYLGLLAEAKALRSRCGPHQIHKTNWISVEHLRVVEARWITPAQDVDWGWKQRLRGLPDPDEASRGHLRDPE